MFKVLWNASILATGAAGAVGCFHTFQGFTRRSVLAESIQNDDGSRSHLDGVLNDLDLELKQVQVVYRHGARTPLHVLEGYRQVPYHDTIMRPHPLTLFPYQRISSVTGKPIEWSPYEQRLRKKNLLSGGSIPGHLTSYGQEQMYGLGLRIREAYGDQLGLSTFDPDKFYVLSTNVTRTVESTRCVIAGIYGADHLNEYISRNGLFPILVSEPTNNILVPDTGSCDLLRQVNHAAMLHFDFEKSLKEDRIMLERLIDNAHDQIQDELGKAQRKFSDALTSYDKRIELLKGASSTSASNTVLYNTYREPSNYDKQLYDSIRERDDMADKVNHFWHNVFLNHPTLGKGLKREELKALLHLRKLEVEEFDLKFSKGYRFRFHFDPNPYFHNREICKETLIGPDGTPVSSKTTNILWKSGQEIKSNTGESTGEDHPISLFSWLLEETTNGPDEVGQYLKEMWRKPLDYYKHVSYKMDHSTTKKLNFVFLYDDMKARVTHGWDCPKELLGFFGTTVENGTRVMHYAMTGRHEQERVVVTGLAVGRMLLDMRDRADRVIDGTNQEKICLYSSHDSTLVALYESLGFWENKWPQFGADVRLELYQDRKTSEYYARVLVLGEPVKLRGQEQALIPWTTFKKVINPYVITQEQFEKTCASNFLEKVAKDLLEHEEGEVLEEKKSQRISSTPAGM